MTLPLTSFEHRADIGMRERGHGPHFAIETRPRFPLCEGFSGDHFQRYDAARLHILGLIDRAHGAAADFFDNTIPRYDFTALHVGRETLSYQVAETLCGCATWAPGRRMMNRAPRPGSDSTHMSPP